MNMKCRGGPCDGISVDVHCGQRVVDVPVPVKKEYTRMSGKITAISGLVETAIYIKERWISEHDVPFFKLVYAGMG